MRTIAFGASFAAAALAVPNVHVEMFEEFATKYERKYTAEEKQRRLEIFHANMEFIEASNAKKPGYTLGVTPFADLTFDEFKAQYIGGVTPLTDELKANMTKFEKPADFEEPDSIDWVEKGAVTDVKNQGKCGSCWSFSATGALEGAMVVAGRKLTSLSEQELLDCDTGLLGGHGCSGGNPVQAFGWVKSNGMCADANYPYQCADATAEACTSSLKSCTKDSKCSTPVLKKGGWITSGDVTTYGIVTQDSSSLEAAVARQPISVAIEADQAAFQHYTGGVLNNDACGQTCDHGVLVVGYGTQKSFLGSDQAYWKVKNSWGSSWGEHGYIRLAKGVTEGKGECGIRSMASYPTVKPSESQVVV